MRRILLLLAVALAMVVMAMPSAAAQDPPTKFCYIEDDGGFEEPGSIDSGPTCFATLQECLRAQGQGIVEYGKPTPTGCSPQAKIETQKPS